MMSLVANWGQYPKADGHIYDFEFQDEIYQYFDSQDHFIPRGLGRSYGDASLAKEMLSTTKFDKILAFDHSKGIIHCQSGVSFEKLLQFLIPRGWFLPVTPGTKFITVGGAIASDIHGKNHHVDGSFSSHLLQFTLLLADATIKRCSKENNHDLFWLTVGGMGLSGLILSASFTLKKIETAYICQKTVKTKSLKETCELFNQTADWPYSVAWVDRTAKGSKMGRSHLLLGKHASLADLPKKYHNNALSPKLSKKKKIPFHLPSFVINYYSVKCFNTLKYKLTVKNGNTNVIDYDKYFYPLDSLVDWYKLYGNNGFLQYQFVIPKSSDSFSILAEILQIILASKLSSPLTVLKQFGPQEGLLSFPMEGYTLAIDFPVKKGVFDLCNRLDAVVKRAQGRIYLAKDARMSKELFFQTYHNAETFVSRLLQTSPQLRFRSIQSNRLGITS